MTQVGETSADAKPPEFDEPVGDKEPLKIRCLLFFDGTLNNRDNIRERIKHESGQTSDIYLKNRANQDKEARLAAGAAGVDLEEDSYENDFSNIVHLEANIAATQKGYDERVKIYIEGAGTVEYAPEFEKDAQGKIILDEYGNPKEKIGDNKDRMGGYAFAAGKSGIKAKVDWGIRVAIAKIALDQSSATRKTYDHTKFYIEKLTIDLFGFSRGAASARYCVHQLLKSIDVGDEQGSVETYIQYRLRAMYWLQVKEVEVKFVGLFDTVVSYKAAQAIKLGGSLENWLTKQTAIKHTLVKKVVHLVSAEEHRDQFCLHNINSAGGKGEEYFLPGVHSDVGGGYLDNSSDAGLKVTQAHPYWAKKDRDEYLVALGWYKNEQIIEDVMMYNENGEPDFVELSVTRDKVKARTVRNAYANIPLKIMAEKAEESDIALKSKLTRDATRKINAFTELNQLESRIKGHMGKVGCAAPNLSTGNWLSRR